MKNKEKYLDELIDEVYEKGYPCDFIDAHCNFDCVGDNQEDCDVCKEKLKKWLEQEHIEKPRLSHDEYVILKNMDKTYKWITRDFFSSLITVHGDKPKKEGDCWEFRLGRNRDVTLFDKLFQFIKWQDEEPYEIKALLDEYEKFYGGKQHEICRF